MSTKLKAGPLPVAPLEGNPYADWSARLFTADRTQYILLTHTTSLYSVVMFGRGITCDVISVERAIEDIRKFMEYDGLKLIYMGFIAPATGSVHLYKALNRSVTGSMNKLVAEAKYSLETGEWSPFDVGFKLDDIPLSAINHASPRKVFKRLDHGPSADNPA